TDALLRVDGPTDQSIIYVASGGENCIVSTHRAAAQATPAWAEELLQRNAARGDILLMQGNLPLATTLAALAEARRQAVTTVRTPGPIHYGYEDLFPLTEVATLNGAEAAELGTSADPVAAGGAILAGGVPQVIVTLGRDGAILIDQAGQRPIAAPAVAA